MYLAGVPTSLCQILSQQLLDDVMRFCQWDSEQPQQRHPSHRKWSLPALVQWLRPSSFGA